MKHFLLAFSMLALAPVGLPAAADLPPPPGYAAPEPPKPKLSHRSFGTRRYAQPVMTTDGMIVVNDPRGDYDRTQPYRYLDLMRVTLVPLTENDILVTIDFSDSMPSSSEAEAMVNIFFSLDLDQDVTTGNVFDELGVDVGIKLQGFDSTQPWLARVKTHSEIAADYSISVKNLQYTSRALTFILRTNGPKKLEQFGLQVGALHDYNSVDKIPNQAPLYIDLDQVGG